jgi:hypothetical protein
MRFLLAFVLTFLSVFAIAQAPPMVLGGPQGIDVTRIVSRNWMAIPIMSDTPVAPLTGSGWPGKGYIVHVAKANDTAVWQYTGTRWARIGGVAENNYTALVSGGRFSRLLFLNRFSIVASTYYIRGVFYSSPLTQLNGFPKTPNANSRIDVIALGTTGPVIVQGAESLNPISPTIGASRIQLGIVYYRPFDSLPQISGNVLQSVFTRPGVDSIFFVTQDTVIRVRDSVGRPIAGNLIDVSRDTVHFGDTLIRNTTFNTNGYTYRILRSGGDTLFNITPQGDIMLKGRIVPDSAALFSVTLKGNRIAMLDSIDGTESFEPKMLLQYTPNRHGLSIYPVGVFGGINGQNKASLNTISGDSTIGAISHTALGAHSVGSGITFFKDRTPASSYRRSVGGANLQPNDVALDISASGGYYVSALSNVSYKGLGGMRIVIDSLFGTNYRSNMRFFTGDGSTQFATEKMRLTNDGMLSINTTSSSILNYKFWANGNARIGNLEILSGFNASNTGQGIRIDGVDRTFKFQGTGGSAASSTFQFATWIGDTVPASVGEPNLNKDVILISQGFYRTLGPQYDTGRFNILHINPKYNIFYDSGHSIIRGIYYNPIVQALNKTTHIAYQNTTGSNLLNSSFGNTRIGYNTSDTTFKLDVNGDARITRLLVNTTTLDTSAAVNIVSTTKGFLQPRMTNTERNAITAPATGLQVFSTTDSANYVYRGTGGGWQKIANEISGSATLDFPSTNNGNKSDLTINGITGAEEGDVVALGIPNSVNLNHSCFTAWVSAANTVTVRFSNYGTGALDPVSATFKVKVFK